MQRGAIKLVNRLKWLNVGPGDKVLVGHAKDFRAYWGNEQSLSKKKVMVDCNNHYQFFLFHPSFSLPTPYI